MEYKDLFEDFSLEELLRRAIDHKRESYQSLKKAARKIGDLNVRELLVQQIINERVSREELKQILENIQNQRELEKGMAG